MLALRLSDGFDFENYPDVFPFLQKLCDAGLGTLKETRFSLTDRGMAVSNSIITEILERVE
jgi:coproporphyrinogen III oxidase-like Fe-S oxidoreductase